MPAKALPRFKRGGKGEHWHKPDRQKRCVRCGETMPLSEFSACAYTTNQGKRSVRYESRCKPCNRQRRKEQYYSAPEIEAEKSRKRRQLHGEKYRVAAARYRSTEHGKRVKARSQRARKARMKAGIAGPEKAEIRRIYAEALELEALFGVKIHVDHRIPLARGGKHAPENLQIMLARENMIKGTKLPEEVAGA